MNPQTERLLLPGPAGALECALDGPPVSGNSPVGVAVICHPHPQHGGTMDNKVVQTLARAFVHLGYRTVRFNFRGVGQSAGTWDEGRGELDDALAVVNAQAQVQVQVQAHSGLPLVLAGFSFGAYIAAKAAQQLQGSAQPVQRLALIGPAASRFELPPVPADTLVVHGETDDVVPLSAVFDWARPQSLPIVVVPGTGHFFHGQLALLKTLVLRAWA